ncbi:Uncharacterised protein [Yersinia nurmii]|uniref:Uncharacterized protein n=1 Tax=Yersinia nurmii TaxID=685706 RepID=A0ABM9S783_9GAMM|nr:Uncharacterised protein [Yersinia nurmii]
MDSLFYAIVEAMIGFVVNVFLSLFKIFSDLIDTIYSSTNGNKWRRILITLCTFFSLLGIAIILAVLYH